MAYNKAATAALQKIIDSEAINDDIENQIRELIKSGADITIRQEGSENTLLLFAIVKNRKSLAAYLITELIKEHREVLDFKDSLEHAGNTALMLSIKKGFYDIARQLLAEGINPNICATIDQLTPLHVACGLLGARYENKRSLLGRVHDYTLELPLIALIKDLIVHGAACDAKNSFGTTPLDLLTMKFSENDTKHFRKKKPLLGVFAKFPEELVLDYEKNILNLLILAWKLQLTLYMKRCLINIKK